MARFFNEYPYTDFHELNIDWVLSTVKNLKEEYEGELTEQLRIFIREKLHDLFVNCVYEAENERLKLNFESVIISSGDLHVYRESDKSIIIEGDSNDG